MTVDSFGKRVIARLDIVSARNKKVLDRTEKAKEILSNKVMPIVNKNLKTNEFLKGALREIYSVLEEDGEELSQAHLELQETTTSLAAAVKLLEDAGFDFANIQTISQENIWLGNHLPTIKRAVEIFDIPLLEIALDESDQERFEDIAHAVQRSGKKRENKPPQEEP